MLNHNCIPCTLILTISLVSSSSHKRSHTSIVQLESIKVNSNTISNIVHRLPLGKCKADRFHVLKRGGSKTCSDIAKLRAFQRPSCKRARLEVRCAFSVYALYGETSVLQKEPFVRLVRA